MKRTASVGLLLLALAALAGAARAQDAPPLDPATIPARGARVQDFVPRGWKIEQRAGGDLNRDGRADSVLHLVSAETPDDRSYADAAPEAHALVILLAEAGGRFRRGGVAPRVLQPIVPQYSLELTVRSGVLVAEQAWGMNQVMNTTHRFRLDPATGRFVLIGRDSFFYTRPLSRDDTVRRSENYLTGVRLVTTGHVRGGVVARESTRQERIPRSKVYFEDVDEIDEG